LTEIIVGAKRVVSRGLVQLVDLGSNRLNLSLGQILGDLGTGLGLSMTHDIVVKQHGGRIEVET
jgi:signal transduction histidine kinase